MLQIAEVGRGQEAGDDHRLQQVERPDADLKARVDHDAARRDPPDRPRLGEVRIYVRPPRDRGSFDVPLIVRAHGRKRSRRPRALRQ